MPAADSSVFTSSPGNANPDSPRYIALDFDGVIHPAYVGPYFDDFTVPFAPDAFIANVNRRALDEHTAGLPESQELVLESVPFLFNRLAYLAALLDSSPGTRIVISTSWREHLDLMQFKALLPPAVSTRLEDVLPYPDDGDHCMSGLRGRLMQAWIESHAPGVPWVALDDQAQHYAWHLKHLVFCDPATGMDESSIHRVLDAFACQRSVPVR
jgi:hypothetical protein